MCYFNVHACGAMVKIASGIDAVIRAVEIRGSSVMYDVGYFVNGEHYTVWLTPAEIFVMGHNDKMRIGFTSGG